jgi:predicted O-methyltransferase YrrM
MIQTTKLYDFGANPDKIIHFLGGIMFPRVYVEFGLSLGVTFIPTVSAFGFENTDMHVVEYAIQSDVIRNNPQVFNKPNVTLHEMSTDAFSNGPLTQLEAIDLAFIDADHNPEQVMKDFNNIYSKLSEHGIILLHDTWPNNKALLDPMICDRSFTLPELIKKSHPELEVFTFRIPLGLTMIQKTPSIEHLI